MPSQSRRTNSPTDSTTGSGNECVQPSSSNDKGSPGNSALCEQLPGDAPADAPGLSELYQLGQDARGVSTFFDAAEDHLYKNVNTARDALDGGSLLKHGFAAAAETLKGESSLARVAVGKLDDITSAYPELYDHPQATRTLRYIQQVDDSYDRLRGDAPAILAVQGYKGKPFLGDEVDATHVPDMIDKGKVYPYLIKEMGHWNDLLVTSAMVKAWGDSHTEDVYEGISPWNRITAVQNDVRAYKQLVSRFKGGDALFVLSALKESKVHPWIVLGLSTYADVNKEALLAEYQKQEQMGTTVAKLQGHKSMGDGFYKAAGGVLDTLLPSEGTKGKFQINVNIPVAGGGAVTVGFEFKGEAERGDKNKLKTWLEMGATLTGKVDAWLFKAFLRARIFGYMEAQGDNGAEVFRLMAMALEKRVRSVSDRLADAIFSDYTISMAEAGMDKDDYVESGLGASITGGFGSGDGSRGGSAGAQYTSGTRLTKGDDGEIKSTGTSQFEVSASLKADPFNLNGKFTLQWMAGRLEKIELEVSGAHEIDLEKLQAMLAGQWLTGNIAAIKSLIENKKKLAQEKGWDAQKVGMLSQAMTGLLGADIVGAKGVDAALRKVKSFQGVKLGHKVTIKGGWERGKGPTAELLIERYGKLEIGDEVHSTFYLMLEGSQRVLRAKYPSG